MRLLYRQLLPFSRSLHMFNHFFPDTVILGSGNLCSFCLAEALIRLFLQSQAFLVEFVQILVKRIGGRAFRTLTVSSVLGITFFSGRLLARC